MGSGDLKYQKAVTLLTYKYSAALGDVLRALLLCLELTRAIAATLMANALEALSSDEWEVALRTFVMAREMGGTNQVESAVFAQINNVTSGTGLSKS